MSQLFTDPKSSSQEVPDTDMPESSKKRKLKPSSDEILLLQKEVLTQQLANQRRLAGVLESAQIAFDSLNNLLPILCRLQATASLR